MQRKGLGTLNHLRVRPDLMTFGDHPPDQRLAIFREDILLIIPVDEERGWNIVVPQGVKNLRRVDIRAIIKGQRNRSGQGAASDDCSNGH